VQVNRLVDGSRRITHVTEVLRMESDMITMQDIFLAKPAEDAKEAGAGNRLLGPLRCTGIKPHFLHKMAGNGVNLPANFFQLEADRSGATGFQAFGRQQGPK
jgi:pilus assembly protein CpaF